MVSLSYTLRYAKYLFSVLLVSCAVFMLKLVLQFNNEEQATENLLIGNYTYNKSEKLSDVYTLQMIKSDYLRCIIMPRKSVCAETDQRHVPVFNANESSASEVDKNFDDASSKRREDPGDSERNNPMYLAFVEFMRFCVSVNIDPILIEPSVLFCMLTSENQQLLLNRGFNVSGLLGRENVFTFAINEEGSSRLASHEVMTRLMPTEFKYWSLATKMEDDDDSPSRGNLKSHYFFVHRRVIIHVVVLYSRYYYLWHGGIDMLPNEILDLVSIDDLLFSKTEAIYERFEPVEIPDESATEVVHIPSDPRFFLHQIQTSQFLHCNISNAAYIKKVNGTDPELKAFEDNTLIALLEMKRHLNPHLMDFWIVGGTLLGWYRQCGIIPYTTDIDFAAWASGLSDVATWNKLKEELKNNEHLRLREIMGLPKEALEFKFHCHGTKVDLFFCYDDGEHYWVSGHRPSKGYYFPYYYPKYTLCSADLLGHKVQVPCQTLDVLLSDYGPDWVKPIEKWNYEVSPKNMGKKRYWYKKERPLIYQLLF